MKEKIGEKTEFYRILDRFISDKNAKITKNDLEKNPLLVAAELLTYIAQKENIQGETVPISIFANDKLTIFEAIIKYLREEKKMAYNKIGQLVDRKTTTISTTYFRAQQKMQGKLLVEGQFVIPLSEFISKKTFSPLEVIVFYLHTVNNFSFNVIAKYLNRDNRTIWTVFHRAKNKQ